MSNFSSIGFLGTGIMGAGMVQNLLKNGFPVNILAHKNRVKIDRLVTYGATELCSLTDVAKKSDILILCLPNSHTVSAVLDTINPFLKTTTLIVDCTTNSVKAVERFQNQATTSGYRYAEAPLTGGQKQAEMASLGAMVGCSEEDFNDVSAALKPCCQTIERMGNIGSGTKAKLVSNFLALGTATLVVEAMKAARDFGVNWEKFYNLASRGSGRSMSLDRIAPKAIQGDYKGYMFSITNTAKDFRYINDLFMEKDIELSKLAKWMLKQYEDAETKGLGNSVLSQRLDPALMNR